MSFAAQFDHLHADGAPTTQLSPELESAVHGFADRFSLTARETEIIGLLVAGYGTVPALARHLELSPNTVHNHFKNVFRRTRTNSKTGVLSLFIRQLTGNENQTDWPS